MSNEAIGINAQMRELLAAERERIAGTRLVAWALEACAGWAVMAALWLLTS